MPFQPNLTCLSDNPLSELYATLVPITRKVLLINDRSLVFAEKPFAVRKKNAAQRSFVGSARRPCAENRMLKKIFAIRDS
jgi:hypothetical protein